MASGATFRPLSTLSAVLALLGALAYACGGTTAGPSSDAGIEDEDAGGDSEPDFDSGPPAADTGGITFSTTAALAMGNAFSCRLTTTGVLDCWGSDLSGALGDGIGTNRGDGINEMGDPLAALDFGLSTVAQLSAFDSFTCAVLADATVKCFGKAAPGYGDRNDRGDQPSTEMGAALLPISLGTGRTAKSVATGSAHACAVLDDATLKCWGDNTNGQLGLGDTNARGFAPSQMGDTLPAIALGTSRTAKAVAAGTAHTCAILDDGTVKCWGANTSGQLGQGDTAQRGDTAASTPDKITAIDLGAGRTALQIAAGGAYTCAILDDNGVKCWGANESGELGQGDTTTRGSAVNQMGANLTEIDLGGHTAKTIATSGGASGAHTCAILDDSSVKCWGRNAIGELGLGDTQNRGDAANEMGTHLAAVDLGVGRTAKALAVGFQNSCAVLDNSSAKCWGGNADGELGQGDKAARGGATGQMGAALPAINLGAGITASSIVAGSSHVCAVLPNGKAKCWGQGIEGRIAVSTAVGDEANEVTTKMTPVDLGANQPREVCTGLAFACAHLDHDAIKCWGDNSSGQLGLGDIQNRGDDQGEMGTALGAVNLGTGHSAQIVTCGATHACAILEDSSVKCWGDNTHGQLGLGDTRARGLAKSDMGDALLAVNVGTGRTVKSIVASGDTTCAILDDSSLKCWGKNDTGQLGLGDTTDRGTAAGQMGDALTAVSLGTGLSARVLSGGPNGNHRCTVLNDQTMKCWGDNAVAELGAGDLTSRGTTAGSMGDALLPVNLGTDIVPVSLGTTDAVTCESDTSGVIRCFGTDAVGLFGLGSVNVVVGQFASDLGPALQKVDLGPGGIIRSLALGGAHACAIFDDQSVKCWGANDSGQLGVGDVVSRGGAPNQMGANLPRLTLPAP